MLSPLSNLSDNLAEELHKGKCKDFRYCLDYVTVNFGLLVFKWEDCNKNYEKEFGREFCQEISYSTYKFYNGNINKH